MKKVTMKDTVREAGVSITTASKILNNVDMHTNEATRERVMGPVKEYNYIPNQIAKGLRRNNSGTISVVTYDISDPYVSEIVRGVEFVCKANRFGVIICNTSPEKEKELEDLQFLGSKMVNGVIFLHSLSPKNEKWVSNIKTSIIVVDRELSMHIPGMRVVDSSSVDAIYQATQLLIREGRRKMSYIGPSPELRSSNRIKGYRNALKDNGITLNEQFMYQKGASNPETGIQGAASLFTGTGIDGVVCANDLIASGVLLMLSRKEIRVPKDVKVIGIDNIPISQYLIPPLTTVDLHGYQVGSECTEMLISRIRDDIPLSQKLVDYEIVTREPV